VTREVITHHVCNPGNEPPRNIVGNYKLRYGTLGQLIRKKHFIVPAQTQQSHVYRLSPENKGVSPYIPLQTGYRKKSKI
jgi:hypothetical protein